MNKTYQIDSLQEKIRQMIEEANVDNNVQLNFNKTIPALEELVKEEKRKAYKQGYGIGYTDGVINFTPDINADTEIVK